MKSQNCYSDLDLFWNDIFARPRSKLTTVSRFSRQNDTSLRALNVVLWGHLLLVLESKGPYLLVATAFVSITLVLLLFFQLEPISECPRWLQSVSAFCRDVTSVPEPLPLQHRSQVGGPGNEVGRKRVPRLCGTLNKEKKTFTLWNKRFCSFRTWFRSINHLNQLLYFQMFNKTYRSVANVAPEWNTLNSGKEEIGS